MKKNTICLLCTLAMAVSMTGCGSKNAAYIKELKNVSDYVQLDQYKGLTIEAQKDEVTTADVDYYIEYILSTHTHEQEVTDRAVQSGDIATIDFAGYLDGVAFEGGTATGYDLEIGSGSFIEGFEDGLIGVEIGETVNLDLTFPEYYPGNPDLAGKPVVFEVTVHKISEKTASELTDAFVSTLAIDGVTTVNAYRNYVKAEMEKEATAVFENTAEDLLLEQIVENSTYTEIPEKMKTRYYTVHVKRMESLAMSNGMTLDQYMRTYYNMEREEYTEVLQNDAEYSAKQYLSLCLIAEKESLTLTDEQMNDWFEDLALQSGYSDVETFKNTIDVGTYEEYIIGENVLDYLTSVNEIVAVTPVE